MSEPKVEQEDLVDTIEKGGRRIADMIRIALGVATLAAAVYLFIEGNLQAVVDLVLVRLPETLRLALNDMLLGGLGWLRGNLEVFLGGVYFQHSLFGAGVIVIGLLLRFGMFWFMRLSAGVRELFISMSMFASVLLVLLFWNLVYYGGTVGGIAWHFENSASFEIGSGLSLTSRLVSDAVLWWPRAIIVVATAGASLILFVAFDTSTKGPRNPGIMLVGAIAGAMGLAASWQYVDARLAPKPAFVEARSCERTTISQLSAREDLILGEIEKATAADITAAMGTRSARDQRSGDHVACLEFQLGSTPRFRVAFLLARHTSNSSQCDIFAIDGEWGGGALAVRSAKLLKTFYGPDCEGVKSGFNKVAAEYFDAAALDTYLHTNEGLPIVTQ